MILKTFVYKMQLVAVVFLLLGLVAGCTQAHWMKPVSLPKDFKSNQSEETMSGSAAGGQSYETVPEFQRKIKVDKKLPPPTAAPKETFSLNKITLPDGQVMINAEKMPLSEFIIYALGETLKIAFVMDDKVMNDRRPVTLRMPQPMAAAKALEIVAGFMEKEGLRLEEKAGALYILQSSPSPLRSEPVDVRFGYETSDSSASIIQFVPLKHISFAEITSLMKDMLKTTASIKAYKPNLLMIQARAEEIGPIIEFLEIFDVPYLYKKKIFLMRLNYWQVNDFVSQLTSIMLNMGFTVARKPDTPGVMFIPIKQMNSILVISPDDNTTKYILEWKDKLDSVTAAGTGEKAYTYSPLYSKASQLVDSLSKLYGVVASATGKQVAAQANSGGSFASGNLKVAADDNKNIILIVGMPDTYKQVFDLLKGLDVPTKQVLIEATIVEFTLTDDLKYGVEWYIKDSQSNGQYTLGTLGKLGLSSLGLSYSFISQTANFQALIAAKASTNKANILSTPRLMVLDNKEATIQVGQDVPVVSSQLSNTSSISTTDTNVLQSITYRNTGVILRVKPTINTAGLLMLDITQEVSEVGATGAGNSPIILTRRINTSVIVGHGQTLALGGLMKDNKSSAVTKVPILGDIPLLGNVFKYTTQSGDKTELLILVTPTIITSVSEGTRITDQMKQDLKWLKIGH